MSDAPAVTPVEAMTTEVVAAPHGFPWEWAGHTFRVKPQFDIRCVAALQRGDFNRALTFLLGDEQTAELLAIDSDEPFGSDELKELVEIAAKQNGTTSGESSASTSFS